ncbi:MAG: rRNA (cytidine1920-2-O)/16S rRNA (cytidine1409-2-O)-methyltransferase [Actinomycetota bacterium]|nr:rRNA (cytidine1920-2-O)/16S rRNA (cytidine1409-2-O)-methyltransferase [Actinomycetota bacterium]
MGGAPADKPARLVGADEAIVILEPPSPYVGRGGHKLEGALERFAIDVGGRRALDAGASTGGFTDCLLQRGASQVIAVDVGRGQLHPRLRGDERVRVFERTNIRDVNVADHLDGVPVDLVVADLSFISLRTAAPMLAGPLAAPEADLVLLVKPQFEVGRAEAARGRGVIKAPDLWLQALEGVASALGGQGAAMMGAMVSPLRGADGNVEFLVHLRAHAQGASGSIVDLGAVVAEAAAGHEV